MDDLELLPISEKYTAEIATWFQNDALSGEFTGSYKNAQQWSDATKLHPRREEWVALVGGHLVGYISLTTDQNHVGHITFAVKPHDRRHGIGNEILEQFLKRPEIKILPKVRSSVSHSNTAAQIILKKNGFSQARYDQEGALEFEKIIV